MSDLSHSLVATTFSRNGPLTQEQWDSITKELASTLGQATEAPTKYSNRPLDTSAPTSTVREHTLALPPKNPLPTLPECAALTRDAPLTTLQKTHRITLVLQPGPLYALHREPGLIIFDMDSTLIQQEVIDELARSIGLYDAVAAITEAAMRGEAPYTDFASSLRARAALLKGVEKSIWTTLREEVITFTPGARELVRFLKLRGWKAGVLSGGFTPLAEWVMAELGLDYAEANLLVEEEGLLTGELVQGKAIVDGERKRGLLGLIAEREEVEVGRTVAVGDGSNDLPMMGRAGLGVAFNAKPKVQERAPAVVNGKGLLDVAYLLGYTAEEVMGTLREELAFVDGHVRVRRPGTGQ